MKKLFFKIICLIFIVLVLSKFIRLFIPYHSLSSYTEGQRLLFERNKSQNANVFFIGTSRIQRGIDPVTFDKAINPELNINSFNYGLAGASTGEVYGLLNHLLTNPIPDLKYIFVEIQSIRNSVNDKKFFGINRRTDRNKYWVDSEQYFNMISLVNGLNPKIYSVSKKRNTIFNYTTSFLENQFNAGLYQSFAVSTIEKNSRYTKYLDNGSDKGYFPLDSETSKKTLKRNNKFLSNAPVSVVKSLAKISMQEYNAIHVNIKHVNILNKYIKKGKDKNIEVIYLFPHPVLFFEEIKPVYDKLPNKNKINISPYNLHPKLYQVENYFDNTHLSSKGAVIYSQALAKKFTSKILQ